MARATSGGTSSPHARSASSRRRRSGAAGALRLFPAKRSSSRSPTASGGGSVLGHLNDAALGAAAIVRRCRGRWRREDQRADVGVGRNIAGDVDPQFGDRRVLAAPAADYRYAIGSPFSKCFIEGGLDLGPCHHRAEIVPEQFADRRSVELFDQGDRVVEKFIRVCRLTRTGVARAVLRPFMPLNP